MAIGFDCLAKPAIAQSGDLDNSKKSPSKRTVTAVADRQLAPEPR